MLIAISSKNKRIKKTVYYFRDDTNSRTAHNIKQFDNIQYQQFTGTRARRKAISYISDRIQQQFDNIQYQ